MPKTKEQIRNLAEKSANDDLKKNFNQLLIDVHDELLQEKREGSKTDLHTENMVHAQKRLASLTVKNAIENIGLQESIKKLTITLVFLTVILLILTIIMVLPK